MSRDIELEKRIDAYIKGKLSEEESQELWEDLLQRPDYLELLETELGLKSIMNNDNEIGDPNESNIREEGIIYSFQKSWKWVAAAASVAILVVALNLLQTDTTKPLSELTIGNINISSNLATAPVFRSQKDVISSSDSLLNRGFKAAISGDIQRAMEVYDLVISRYGDTPAAVQAHLNKGIIQYNGKEFSKAIASFEKVIEHAKEKTVTREKAYWFMGNAYINIDQLAEAQKALQKAYDMDGIYRESTHRLLQNLSQEIGNNDSNTPEQQNE